MYVDVCVVTKKGMIGPQHTMNMSCLEIRVTDVFFIDPCVVSLCEINTFSFCGFGKANVINHV